jgi:hypothetical protein
MRFMMLVKHPEVTTPIPPALMEAIGKLSEEAVKNGTMVMAGGLCSTAQSSQVKISDGKISVIDGPFTETKEIVGGFAIFDLKDKQTAVESAKKFMDLHVQHWPGWNGTTEVRQLMGPEDMVSR